MIPPRKILVIQTAFTGDVILATSLLEKVHNAFPVAGVDVLVRKGNETLFDHHPYVGKVLIWDKKKAKYKGLWSLLKEIRKSKYDWVLNLQRYASTGFLTGFSGAPVRTGFRKNPLSFLFSVQKNHVFAQNIHETDRNSTLVEDFLPPGSHAPRLYPSPADVLSVAHYQSGGSYVCISPASVWFTKQFPAEKWAELIEKIYRNHKVYLLGGPGDHSYAETIQARFPADRVDNLCGSLSFLESAVLMKGAVMNFVNDSAPMHLCSAVNAPVTAVYCSTVPEFGYGPMSERSYVVQVEEPLSCRPCGLHGHRACPEEHFNCALQIKAEQLMRSMPA